MKSNQFLGEGFVEDASDVHQDHEVQMARADLFHAAEDALALHKLLRNVSEMQGLEGWVASKITLAADYLNTVREYMEYQLMTGDVNPDIHAAPGVLAIAEGKGSGYTYKDTDEGTYITNTMGETLCVPDVSLFDQGFKQGDRRLPEVWQMNLEMSDETGAYIVGDEQGVAEGSEDNRPWTNKEEEKLRRSVAGLDSMFGKDDAWTKTKQKQIKQQIKTKPMAGPKGQLPEQGVAENAGSVATVVNPTPKNKAKVGTLFGGTYKQKKAK